LVVEAGPDTRSRAKKDVSSTVALKAEGRTFYSSGAPGGSAPHQKNGENRGAFPASPVLAPKAQGGGGGSLRQSLSKAIQRQNKTLRKAQKKLRNGCALKAGTPGTTHPASSFCKARFLESPAAPIGAGGRQKAAKPFGEKESNSKTRTPTTLAPSRASGHMGLHQHQGKYGKPPSHP